MNPSSSIEPRKVPLMDLTKQNMELQSLLLEFYRQVHKLCVEYGCDTCLFRHTCQNGEPAILFGKYKVTVERLDK